MDLKAEEDEEEPAEQETEFLNPRRRRSVPMVRDDCHILADNNQILQRNVLHKLTSLTRLPPSFVIPHLSRYDLLTLRAYFHLRLLSIYSGQGYYTTHRVC